MRWLFLGTILGSAIGGVSLTCNAEELEKIPAGEKQAIEEIGTLAVGELEKRYPEPSDREPNNSKPSHPLVLRDAHAKAHGCVKAVFEVDANIAPSLRVGTFKQPMQQFKALVRFSNSALVPGPDTEPDGRGMALKIISADPLQKFSEPKPVHDIIMINYPVFFTPNVNEYLDFARAGALNGNTESLKRYFLPGYNPFHWRLRQGYLVYRIISQKVSSPLSVQYYSMSPFLYGPDRAVKYSARPCSQIKEADVKPGPDFLQEALQKDLSQGAACFELLVQEHKPGQDIEDATADWTESVSPYQLVGKVHIPSQEVLSEARKTECENLSFNPWNAPSDQRPLGGINRLREEVYKRISKHRMERNKVAPRDPELVWDTF